MSLSACPVPLGPHPASSLPSCSQECPEIFSHMIISHCCQTAHHNIFKAVWTIHLTLQFLPVTVTSVLFLFLSPLTVSLLSRMCQLKKYAMAQAVSYWPLTAGSRFDPSPVHVMFMADRVTLGQVLLILIQFILSV